MAYRKRFYRRRNYKRRSVPWYRKKYSAVQLASKAVAGVRYLKGLVNAELHKRDSVGGINPDYIGSMISLNNIAQGNADNERTGNSIFVRYVNSSGMITMSSLATSTAVRVMLVCDKQQIGDTPPTAPMVLENTASTTAPYSKLNSDTVGRFTILSSKLYLLNSDRPSCSWFLKKSMRHHIRYNGATSTDIQKGGLYLLVISNEQNNVPNFTRDTRVSYYDN